MIDTGPATVRRQTGSVAVGDDVIHFETATPVRDDAGEPVVLIHGSGGNRATWWPVVSALAADRTVVTVDVRGSGRSTDTASGLGPEQVAIDLDAVRRSLGVARWHVAGHSFGSWHALRYAADFPESTASAVAVGGVGGCLNDAVRAWLADFMRLAATWSAGDELGRSASLSETFTAAHAEQVHLHQMLRDLNPPVVRGVPGERMTEVALTSAQLDTLAGVRTLFIAAGKDPFAPPEVVRAAATSIQGAEVIEISDAGHMCFWEQPHAFVRRLTPWLS